MHAGTKIRRRDSETKDLIELPQEETPKYWHNILPDLPEPVPEPKLTKDSKPRRADIIKSLYRLVPKACAAQEYTDLRRVRIPEEVREALMHIGRPMPLHRAHHLEAYLKTPARIYLKREDCLPTGSFKMNTVLAQVYYAKREGFQRMVDGTGAGQTGSAFAWAAKYFGIEAVIFWVRSAWARKRAREIFMKMNGAKVYPSPSKKTPLGRSYLKKDPYHPGSLGIVCGECNETALSDDTITSLQGSVLNYTFLQQTVIGLETLKQLELVDEEPDVMVGCVGAGSNFMGLALPTISERLKGKLECRFISTRIKGITPEIEGEYKYDVLAPGEGPFYKVYTLGVDYHMPDSWAEGLRYHCQGPILAHLTKLGIVETVSYTDREAKEAGKIVMQNEGFLPAPETCFACKSVIDEALKAKETGEEKVIVGNISGHGWISLVGYGQILEIPESESREDYFATHPI